MKALIQRVVKASVTVGDRTPGSIGHGLCVLVGIHRYDTEKEMEFIVRKILNLRLFTDAENKSWSKSVMDMGYEVLCVSQFTLESTLKGNKPDFREAMTAETSKAFYERFLQSLRSQYKPEKIQDGEFGAYMQVHIQNDGPVTIPIEMKPSKPSSEEDKSDGASSQGDKS